MLKDMPEPLALQSLNKFSTIDQYSMRNKNVSIRTCLHLFMKPTWTPMNRWLCSTIPLCLCAVSYSIPPVLNVLNHSHVLLSFLLCVCPVWCRTGNEYYDN